MIRDNWREKYSSRIDELNSEEIILLVKLHNEIIKATFEFFSSKGMIYIPVPSTTGAASSPMEPGSDSAPVKIGIKNITTMLTDSAQFHLEYACRVWKKGSFYYGHSFRDEEPDKRHLAQFNHAEAEIVGTLEDIKKLVEQYIKYITKVLWKNDYQELKDIQGIDKRISTLVDDEFSFKSISFDDAYKLLEGNEDVFVECSKDVFRITPLGERILLDKLGDFIWIERWNKMAVPFYQALNKKEGVALNGDLLFGIGEVVGAGQRHYGESELIVALNEHGLSIDDYKWYVEMKRKFPLCTSGFGMGVERYLMWLLGIKDIRSVEMFSRNSLQMGEI